MADIGVFTLPEIKGDGFILRPFRPEDAASLQQALDDPEVTQRLTNIPQPYTMDHAYGWIAHAAAPITARSDRICFVIDIDGEVAGSVSFINVHFGQRNAQLSTWVAKRYWGKGLATKTVRALIEYGFTELNLHRIFAFYVEDNEKTKKMLERLGFTNEGVHREEWEKEVDGVMQRFDSVHCSLLQHEWQKQPSVYLITYPPEASYAKAARIGKEIGEYLAAHGMVAIHESEYDPKRDAVPTMAIAIGGDGTIMRAIRQYSPRGIPTFGVNGGEVGFLAAAEGGDWKPALERLLKGDFEIEERQGMMLSFRGEVHGPFVNEVKIIDERQLMHYKVRIDDHDFWHDITALGFLVSTATGANAEHFSKHGDVMFPTSGNFGLTPVGAQKAGSRNAMFSYPVRENGSTEVQLLAGRQKAQKADIIVDGIEIAVGEDGMQPGEVLRITASPRPMLAATFGLKQFFRALEEKKGYPLSGC